MATEGGVGGGVVVEWGGVVSVVVWCGGVVVVVVVVSESVLCVCRGGGGGGGRVSDVCACVCASAGALVPPAGMTSQNPYGYFACGSRFQAFQAAKSTNPKARKKVARHAHLTPHSFGGRGAQSFPSPRRWMPWIRNDTRRCTWTCLSRKPNPFPHSTTSIREMTRSNRLSFTTPTTNPG